MRRARIIFAIVSTLAAGCASKTHVAPPESPTTRVAAAEPTTKRSADPKADFTLDQIEPQPVMPTTAPATAESNPPPLAALELFANARDDLIQGRRTAAIRLLEDAIKLDSKSYELWFALGQAQAGVGVASDKSIASFEKAASIDPTRLELQTELGRQYLAKNDLPRAIEHLRLGLQAKKYTEDDDAAAIADFYLAKALEKAGYEKAALQQYDRLLDRLERPVTAIRGVPELAVVVNQPDRLFIQVGELYEKRGEYDDALRAYDMASSRRPDRLDYQQRVVRILMNMGRRDDAADRAAEVVRRFRASDESLKLLAEVYKDAGGDAAVTESLQRLHREKPDDHAFLFALADVLVAQKRQPEAQELFSKAAAQSKYDFDIIRRAVAMCSAQDDVPAAAKLLTEALAAQPESSHELEPMWNELLRSSRKHRVRLPMLQSLEVSPGAEAAKLFWIARIASSPNWRRDAAARNALEQAVKLSPPFAPAFRFLLAQHWTREEWDEKKKTEASQALIDSAQRQGAESLAAELRGLLLLNLKQPAKAADYFARAVRLGGNSPDLQIKYASTLRQNGNTARAEQMLWNLVNERPMCEDAYAVLFQYYIDSKAPQQALKVLGTWRRADPDSVTAKLIESSVRVEMGQTPVAEGILNDLYEHDADNEQVLQHIGAYYASQNKLEQWIGRLEAERTRHPENRIAVQQLVVIYTARNRVADADRVLDAARVAVADDPDLLYYIAGLYTAVGHKEMTEQLLQEVLKLDPNHAPANNDLGYNWADQGKNLDRAEQLIRVALKGEPDNGFFLDSLGWVLYKREKFDEARKYFEAALADTSFPDPIVLDHLGDALYRGGQRADAQREWRRAYQRMSQSSGSSAETRALRLLLEQKIDAAERNVPVNVAPTGAAAPRQQAAATAPAS